MTAYTYTGKLTDFGRSPFPGAQPRLWVEPEQAGYGEPGLLARKRIPVTVASNGDFSVQLESSSSVRPEAVYLLRCEWLESGNVIAWSEWARFRAPAGGGNIGEINELPPPSWSIAYGFGPPPDHLRAGLYIDVQGEKAVLYGPPVGRI